MIYDHTWCLIVDWAFFFEHAVRYCYIINAGMKVKRINWPMVKYAVNQAVIKHVTARPLSLSLS